MLSLRELLALIVLAMLRLGVPILAIWMLYVILTRILRDQQRAE
jgi:hypothetical protein